MKSKTQKPSEGVEWDSHWLYEDSRGTMRAKIVAVCGGNLHMKRWLRKSPNRTVSFEITVRMASPNLSRIMGWMRIESH